MAKKVSVKRTKSKTPIADEMIDKAAEEIAKEDWPGLRETLVSAEDVRKVKRALAKK